MRKLLSILLLCLFGLAPAAPLFAQGEVPESRLPACCRRGGDHRCAGNMSQQDTAERQVSPNPRFAVPIKRCPYNPGTFAAHSGVASPATEKYLASLLAQPLLATRNAAMQRIARHRSCPKRGPPQRA